MFPDTKHFILCIQFSLCVILVTPSFYNFGKGMDCSLNARGGGWVDALVDIIKHELHVLGSLLPDWFEPFRPMWPENLKKFCHLANTMQNSFIRHLLQQKTTDKNLINDKKLYGFPAK
jgi:hypothetical protein